MDWDLYRTFLLNNIPGAEKKSGGKEVNCRCRECPAPCNFTVNFCSS